MKQYLSLSDLSVPEVDKLLALAKEIQQSPIREDLKGKVVGLLFMNPSLPTIASMQSGFPQLGRTSLLNQRVKSTSVFRTVDMAVR